MKKIIAGVLAFTLVGGLVPFNNNITDKYTVYAQGETTEEAEYTEGTYGVLKYKNYGDYIEISDCDESATEVEIPAEIDGVAVTVIGNSAFASCDNLINVTLPDSLLEIRNDSFSECINLSQINLPQTLRSIGINAFYCCIKLASITIPDSVTEIGEGCFSYCLELSSVKLSSNLSSLEDNVFKYCKFKSIVIPNNVTEIGDSTFYACALENITMSENITTIKHYAFAECLHLKSVTLPKSVYFIDECAFIWCNSMETVTILNPECKIYDDGNTISNDGSSYFIGSIHGYENSTAQAYAEKYNRIFVSLGEAPIDKPALLLGDINGSDAVDSSDASNILEVYALVSTGKDSELTEEQKKAADVNKDGSIDSSDASIILAYYAYTQTGGTGTLEEYLNS